MAATHTTPLSTVLQLAYARTVVVRDVDASLAGQVVGGQYRHPSENAGWHQLVYQTES